jgi:hypothetical protein
MVTAKGEKREEVLVGEEGAIFTYFLVVVGGARSPAGGVHVC